MAYPLRALQGMPNAMIAALEAHGIADTEALLEAARLPGRRSDLASRIGVDLDDLDTWASVADLARVTALSPASATLIVRSGVARNVQELVVVLPDLGPIAWSDPLAFDRMPDDATLHVIERLTTYAAAHGLEAYVPWPHDLAQTAAEARNLLPKLVLRDAGLEHDVAAGLAEIRGKTLRNARRTLVGSFAWFVGLIVVAIVVSVLAMRGLVDRQLTGMIAAGEAAVAEATIEIVRGLAMSFVEAAAMAVTVMFVSVIAAYVFIFTTQTLVVEGWRWLGTRVVLRDRATRLAHLDVLRFEASQLPYLTRLYWVWLAGITVLLGALLWVLNAIASTRLTFDQVALIAVSVLVPVFALLAFVPTTRHLMRRTRTRGPLSPHVVRSLVAFNTFTVVVQLGFLVVVLQAFPAILAPPAMWATAVYEDRMGVAFARAAPDLAASLEASWPEATAKEVDAWVGDLEGLFRRFGSSFGATTAEIGTVLQRLSTYLTPSLLLAAVFSIVLPFLILGGWLRGAFFVVLLAAVSWTEIGAQRYVSANLARWFDLDDASRMVPLLVALAVFGNAIVFEWVYELVLERKDTCVDCQADLQRGAVMCSVCGMRQR